MRTCAPTDSAPCAATTSSARPRRGYDRACVDRLERVAVTLLVLALASLVITAATYDHAPSHAQTPLVRAESPDRVTAYAEVDEGVDHDLFIGSGVAFLLSAGLLGTASLRHRRQIVGREPDAA